MNGSEANHRLPIVLVGKRRGFSASMARFYDLLRRGLEEREVNVRGVTPPDWMSRGLPAGKLRYWTEYLEQYVLFPPRLRRRLALWDDEAHCRCLVHVCDHSDALIGRVLRDRPRTITVHDCIPKRVMAGEFPGRAKGQLGRLQQQMIYHGLAGFSDLIAVSEATKADLKRFLPSDRKRTIHVVANGPAVPFRRLSGGESQTRLANVAEYRQWVAAERPPLFLIVGGDVFYKNRGGALALARACGPVAGKEPWVLIIDPMSGSLREFPEMRLLLRESIVDEELEAWYSLAAILLFPSLAEGFGWPLLEAQQTGCLVVTTDRAPMNEVASPEALRLPLMPTGRMERDRWMRNGAAAINRLLAEPPERREQRRQAGYAHVKRYSLDAMLDGYLELWENVLSA